MKRNRIMAQILVFVMCFTMLVTLLPASVFAAKENYMKPCEYIGIRGCAIPVAGEKADFDVEENWPSQYTIMSINWYKGSVSSSNAMGGTERFQGNTVYIVEFEVWANSPYYFTTDSNGYTTVIADISPNYSEYGEYDAQVMNVYGKDNTKYLTVRYTFPKTASTATILNTLTITGVEVPRAGERAKYPVVTLPTGVDYLLDSRGYYYDVAWYNGTTKMTNQDYFEEGVTYSCHMSLRAKDGYEFAADPNHYFAQNGKAYPTVTVTVNGKSATVIPDYSMGSGSEVIIIGAQFTCEASRQITEVEIRNVADPKTGEKPNYIVWFGDNTYSLYPLTNYAYQNGVAWMDKNGNYLTAGKDTFNPSSVYTIEILLKAEDPYIFKYTQQGAAVVSATVNGNEAVVSPSSDGEKYLTVRYTFKKTASLELSKVEVNDIEAPVDGALPDYTMTLGDTTYGPYYSKDDDITKNSILWLDTTTNQYMRVGVDRFVGGHEYSVIIILGTKGDYTFKYVPETDSYTVSAKINGKTAQIEECDEDSVNIYYDFTCAKVEHKCTPTIVPEVKATCTSAGKKAYYHCSECGAYYENEKGTKSIDDIDSWGIIEATGHSGGKATCTDRAICKNCSNPYGELAEHNYGTKWDYTDATGHAHKCKTCGTHDAIVAHSGGDGKCGDYAKCSDCGEKYGEVIQHKWSSALEYTDSKGHAHICSVCGEHDTIVEHSGGSADCKNMAKCSECGTEYGKLGEHKWSNDWGYTDSKGHAHACTVIGCEEHEKTEKHTSSGKATETTPETCTVCGHIITPALGHKHKTEKVKEVKESCTENGVREHYKCTDCGALFEDSAAEVQVDKDDLIIPATGHTESKWKTNRNSHWKECTVRGCKVEIPDTKNTHEYDENQICTVCGYEKGAKVSADEEETEPAHENETEPSEDETTVPKNDENEKSDEETNAQNGANTGDSEGNTGWLIIGIVLIVGVICLIILMVVIIKKGKRE